MIGLILAVILFNFISFKTNKILSTNQIVHIWTFTIALQTLFDMYVEVKYHGYWYFSKGIELAGLIPHLVLIPAVNMMFLNWYPQNSKLLKKILYFTGFVIAILIYEAITLLPEPWGYFHYGWWNLWYAIIIDPILLLILLQYYKWICKLEKKSASHIK
ncbi:CBO0543 family protein [Neobacillus mesonae]|uniref:CBO0543 family protein n=1 Tax=Neobacillus mesonae TaxID=1193713 RepID=UPI00203B5598|nr:CBO0543 family protein [Neobacillus mesonae]MCM3567747.1 hypothetical protein [Neobacillus mesonae]